MIDNKKKSNVTYKRLPEFQFDRNKSNFYRIK